MNAQLLFFLADLSESDSGYVINTSFNAKAPPIWSIVLFLLLVAVGFYVKLQKDLAELSLPSSLITKFVALGAFIPAILGFLLGSFITSLYTDIIVRIVLDIILDELYFLFGR